MTTQGHRYQRVPAIEETHIKLLPAMPKMGIPEPMAMQCDAAGNEIDGIPLRELLANGWVPATQGGKARLRAFAEANQIPLPERFRLVPGGGHIEGEAPPPTDVGDGEQAELEPQPAESVV